MAPAVAEQRPVVPSLAHTLLGAPYEPPLAPSEIDYDLHAPCVTIDAKDHDTPDAWVPRDPCLVRLTGRHPLNCEPPMHTLMEHGFITPARLQYVRNHGLTPKLDWRTHRIKVNGLVNNPIELTMDELLELPWVTLPVTMVCSGNRRKEVNMIKKSKGYNWGSCAVATAYYTGVRLRDVLLKAGIKTQAEGANFVRITGVKGEVAKGDRCYGTSLTVSKAMDLASDVLLAFKHNDRWLLPDHGFPVRLLVPGYISGRMVKWVSEVTVSSTESQNFYHFHDNRALPPHVDEDRAEKEGWLYNPDFVINNLNVNSAVARPWHDEVVPLGRDTGYTLKGYAYAGSGKKVIRVELSLDAAKSWRQATIRRFEKPNAYGKYWCWVHWDIDVQTYDFLQTDELLVRAWDEDMNTQPEAITWNLMGMMNNCQYRIKIHPHRCEDGSLGLRFQHPAPVELGEKGNIGWREEDNIRQQAIAAATSTTSSVAAPATPPRADGTEKSFTMEEVAKHTSEGSAWFVRDGCVYDATRFLPDHPGGAESILLVAGIDASDEFNAIHSARAREMLKSYYIGRLAPPGKAESAADVPAAVPIGTPPDQLGPQAPASPATKDGVSMAGPAAGEVQAPAAADSSQLVALNSRDKVVMPLVEKVVVTHNTRIFRFGLPSPQHRLGLPCGKHVFSYATINGESVVRPYTPISSDDDLGHMDLLIKIYFAGTNPNHPPGGKMSQYLEGLKIGDTVAFKGPIGHFVYEGRGSYLMNRERGTAKHLSMIAGGTGITPIYSVMKAVLKDPSDTTTMSLLFGNVSDDDILLREELDFMVNNYPDRLRVYHVLTVAPPGWTQGSGFITLDMMKERLFPGGQDVLGLMCGPKGLIDHVCLPGFKAMGYTQDKMVMF